MKTVNPNYELIEKREVKELSSTGYLLRHKKTGARVFLLENDDENKVFYIGFRTPPTDSTGVAHIMEHSVLCGSESFPAKDPFVELAKGSMNTFLNAMTYPDKTVYPVASCNDKDFRNLMHVYMDAVFHPNVYTRPQIFKQEGWHYEMTEPDGDLTINGVVYNEMKGAFSSPEDVVDRQVYQMLYPDNAYSNESGGDPDVIPTLTYEGFIDFHRRYYHPSNSYIYLYGNCDMEERLKWLDEEYLSKYDAIEIDSSIAPQKPFDAMKEKEIEYGITEDEETEDNTYLVYSCVIDTALNKELYLAFQILDYTLLSAPGAPLNEKLLRSGLGQDIISTYENGIYQPYFSIMAKNANENDKERFVTTIRQTLKELAGGGLDKKALRAGINYFEFKYREADFGSYPKGLMYGLQCLDSWLYDDKDPFMHISAVETIEYMKSRVDTDYFEKLIEKYLVDNPHCALLTARPVKGLVGKKEAALAGRLLEYKSTLGKEEIDELIRDTKMLKKYQEEPSTPEELATIPLLQISDINREEKKIENETVKEDGTEFVFHEIDTSGIGYVTLLFDMEALPCELLPYAGLAKTLLLMVSTEHYSYFDLANEINSRTGGIGVNIESYHPDITENKVKAFFSADAKYLEKDAGFVFDMFREILFSSVFDDKERVKELLLMLVSRFQMTFMSAGHMVASSRARSYFSVNSAFQEKVAGYDFYRMVEELTGVFDEKFDDIVETIRTVLSLILTKSALKVDFTGSREEFDRVRKETAGFKKLLSDNKYEAEEWKFENRSVNEGFKSSSQVQYVAMAGDFKKAELKYTGALKVLHTILGYEYLWINVRVKGGAYGCMSAFTRSGACYLVSYRDPALSETLEIFKKTSDYLKGFEADEREMRKYIIGTISAMDTPLTPRMRGNRSFTLYMMGIGYDDIQRERNEVLSVTPEDIRALAPYLDAIVAQDHICVIGAEDKIVKEKELFGSVRNLF